MTQGINWPYWRMKQTVEAWEAAALAAGMNPKSIKAHPQGWMAGRGIPVIDSRSFSSLDEKSRFYELWDLAKGMVDVHFRLALPEFVSLLISNDWPGIPEPLRMMAKGAAPALPVSNPAPATAEKLEPVQVAPAKRWTDDALSELAAYRDKHGTKKAAEHFGISDALVRRLLPREKKQTATPFSGLGSRAR